MKGLWKCPDCGTYIPYTRLDEIAQERRERGITISPHFFACKGTDKHISGVAGKFYSLTEKGKHALDALQVWLEEIQSCKESVKT